MEIEPEKGMEAVENRLEYGAYSLYSDHVKLAWS